ncbi:MAG: hypothetical protein AAFZ65_20900 [Planctomycetota bacterium]
MLRSTLPLLLAPAALAQTSGQLLLPQEEVLPLLDFARARVEELREEAEASKDAHLTALASGLGEASLAELLAQSLRIEARVEEIVDAPFLTSDGASVLPLSGMLIDDQAQIAYPFAEVPRDGCDRGILDLPNLLAFQLPVVTDATLQPPWTVFGRILRVEAFGEQLERESARLAEQRAMWLAGRPPISVPAPSWQPTPEAPCPGAFGWLQAFDPRAGQYALRKLQAELLAVQALLERMRRLAVEGAQPATDPRESRVLDSAFQGLDDEINRIATSTEVFGIHLLNVQTPLEVVPDVAGAALIVLDTADLTSASLGIQTFDLTTPSAAASAVIGVESALGPASFGTFGSSFFGLEYYLRQAEQQFEQF